MTRRTTSLLLGSGLILAIGLSPVCFRASNCGGNSAALSWIASIAMEARLGVLSAPDHSFAFTAPDMEQRQTLMKLSRCHWIDHARFLVTTNRVTENDVKARKIIAVCDTPYRNVPRPWFGTAPPTHAAGLADGSHVLISPAEFSALDPGSFAPLEVACAATNKPGARYPR